MFSGFKSLCEQETAVRLDTTNVTIHSPVDNVQVVQILKGQDDLGGVESRMGLAEPTNSPQM